MESIIKELNKQREVQLELQQRQNKLADIIASSQRKYDDGANRLKDVNQKIKELKCQL